MTEQPLSDPEMTPDDALALDLVLGILRDPDRTAALRRIDTDPDFAALAAGHRARLLAPTDAVPGVSSLEIAPRSESWAAISSRLPRKDAD
jgi:anti-sigma-K factor RskA